MGWGAKAYGILTPETAFGTYNSAGTKLYPRLLNDTALILQGDPMRKVFMSAEGGNRRVGVIAPRRATMAKLKTLIYPAQAAALLTWATDISSGDLASYTVDFDDTVQKQRGLGAKVAKLVLSCAVEQDEGALWADLDLVLQTIDGTAPTIAAPAFSAYPTTAPYVHQESAGAFTLGTSGVFRNSYNSFRLEISNVLDVDFEELAYPSAITYCGRTVNLTADLKYLATADATAYDGQAAQSCLITFTKGGNSLLLDLKGQGRISKRTRSLPLGKTARQVLEFEGFYDGTAGTDFSFTAA